MITNMADIVRRAKDGALRQLAIGDGGGSPLFPEVPPLSRLVPGFGVVGWFGLCGPKGMPPEALRRWEDAVRRPTADLAPIRAGRLDGSAQARAGWMSAPCST